MNTDKYIDAIPEADREILARALIRKGYGSRMINFREKFTKEAILALRGSMQGRSRVVNSKHPDGFSYEEMFVMWCKGEEHPFSLVHEQVFMRYLERSYLLITPDHKLTLKGQALADELGVLDAYNQRMCQK